MVVVVVVMMDVVVVYANYESFIYKGITSLLFIKESFLSWFKLRKMGDSVMVSMS